MAEAPARSMNPLPDYRVDASTSPLFGFQFGRASRRVMVTRTRSSAPRAIRHLVEDQRTDSCPPESQLHQQKGAELIKLKILRVMDLLNTGGENMDRLYAEAEAIAEEIGDFLDSVD